MNFIVDSLKIALCLCACEKNQEKPRRCVVYFVLTAVNRKSLFGRKEISKLQFTVSKKLISITETVLSAPLEQQVSVRSRSYLLSLFNGKKMTTKHFYSQE